MARKGASGRQGLSLPLNVQQWQREQIAPLLPDGALGASFSLKNVRSDVPIIGLTGALGSGCSFVAKGLTKYHNYYPGRLSDTIHELDGRSGGSPEGFGRLQDIGNRLRYVFGCDILVRCALTSADEAWQKLEKEQGKPPSGIVLDGIRNLGEVQCLRQLPNFFLVSIQAKEEIREARLKDCGRCNDHDAFVLANSRDQRERGAFGQQIGQCAYHADIVVVNDRNVAKDLGNELQDYIRDKFYDSYVRHIEHLARNPHEEVGHTPTTEAAMMTAAYVASKRSSCLKRKVGAIIATKSGDILSSGHNDVPEGQEPCLKDPAYNQCARDFHQERIGRKLKFCPACGRPVELRSSCAQCGQGITEFTKRCPNCRKDPEVDYTCECGADVFRGFVAGMSPQAGKLLDMCRALHAEDRAILNLIKSGASIPPDAVLYTTTFPCNLCANRIVDAGISKIVFCEPYVTLEAVKILEGRRQDGKKAITVEAFEGVKSTAFFKLYR
jgi:deoxycytidylate deaminase